MQLRSLSPGTRVGLFGLVIVIWMGHAASLFHMYGHYQNRDERPGMTLDDIRSAYHGLNAPSPIKTALERNHPEGLNDASRKALLEWLASGKEAENYDNLDLGDQTPAEIISANCNSCHGGKVAEAKGGKVSLETWDDVKKVAFSRVINPMPVKVLAISTHTHALSLAALSAVVIALVLRTTRCNALVSWLVAINGVSLAADIGSWWAARDFAGMVYAIVGAGALYNASLAMMTLLVVAELLAPKNPVLPS